MSKCCEISNVFGLCPSSTFSSVTNERSAFVCTGGSRMFTTRTFSAAARSRSPNSTASAPPSWLLFARTTASSPPPPSATYELGANACGSPLTCTRWIRSKICR